MWLGSSGTRHCRSARSRRSSMVGVKSPPTSPPRGKAQLCADVFISLSIRNLHNDSWFIMLTMLLTSARDASRVQACLIPYFKSTMFFFFPNLAGRFVLCYGVMLDPALASPKQSFVHTYLKALAIISEVNASSLRCPRAGEQTSSMSFGRGFCVGTVFLFFIRTSRSHSLIFFFRFAHISFFRFRVEL